MDIMDGSPSLLELIDHKDLQAIQDSFATTTGISSVILLPDGLPITCFSNSTDFCKLIQSTTKGRLCCSQSFLKMNETALTLQEPTIMYCFAHSGHFVAPIIINNEHKGTMFAGQFIPQEFSDDQLKEFEKIAISINIDPERLIEEASKMRVVREDAILKYSNLFFQTVKLIVKLGARTNELIHTRDALEHSHAGLETRVQERTLELLKTNKQLQQEITSRNRAMEHFKTLFNIMIDPVIIIDINGMLLEVTDKLEEITGYQKQEMLSKNYLDVGIISTKSHKVITENLSREIILMPYEVELLTKSGEKIPHEVNSARITYLGKPAYMVVFRNIAKRKQAEHELKESEAKYRSLIENLQDGVFLIQDRKIKFANEAFAMIPGYPIEEIIGMDFRDLVAPDDLGMIDDRYIRMMAGEDIPLEFDFCGIRKNDDTQTTVHMTVSLINYLGKPAAMGTVKDITEIKRIEKALLDCQTELNKISIKDVK